MAIPRQLKPILGQHEIKRSLKTTNYTFAVRKARRLAVYAEALFQADIAGRKEFFHSLNYGIRLLTRGSVNLNEALLGHGDHKPDTRHNCMADVTVAPPPPPITVQLFSPQINMPTPTPHSLPALPPLPAVPQPYSMPLSELIDKYCRCQMDEKSWQPKTKDENIRIFDILLRVVGDLPLSGLDHETADLFRPTLKQLPPHVNKNPKYKDLTIEQIIATNPSETLSDSSINKYMRRVCSMLNWAEEREYVSRNCYRRKPIKEAKKANERRDMLTSDDLAVLFNPAQFQAAADQPFKFWVPLIALYTGARQNEIASLDGKDVCQVHGVWCFRFITAKQKEYTERIVPIHSRLREWGIIEFSKGRHEKLFPELDHGRDGYGQAVSKWWARFRRRCNLTDIRNKDFHSLRHTFSTMLYRAGVVPMLISELDGHMTGDGRRRTTTEEVYIKPSEVVVLMEALEKLDYGEPLKWIKSY
ncbi:MAG: tyrosine-type recombinase/integrase [Desulfobulbus sp.]|nr:tyrosine-type recombinase/integrase [Desulfobulbus sp.]